MGVQKITTITPNCVYEVLDEGRVAFESIGKLLERVPGDLGFEARIVEMINSLIGKAISGVYVDALGIVPMKPLYPRETNCK